MICCFRASILEAESELKLRPQKIDFFQCFSRCFRTVRGGVLYPRHFYQGTPSPSRNHFPTDENLIENRKHGKQTSCWGELFSFDFSFTS